MIITIIQL